VFKYDYNYLFFKDKECRNRFYNEYKLCRAYHKRKGNLGFDEKNMRNLKKQFMRKNNVPNYIPKGEGTKKHTRKSNIS
jgi:hypothetical protein